MTKPNFDNLTEVCNDLNNLVNGLISLATVMKVPVNTEELSVTRTKIVDLIRDSRDYVTQLERELTREVETLKSKNSSLYSELNATKAKLSAITSPDKEASFDQHERMEAMRTAINKAVEILIDESDLELY